VPRSVQDCPELPRTAKDCPGVPRNQGVPRTGENK